MAKHLPSKAKAGKILSEGEVRGKPLTPSQRGLFGAIRGGQKIRIQQKNRRMEG